jgi:ATP-dependent Clp protease ATP-binding subunit ClpB
MTSNLGAHHIQEKLAGLDETNREVLLQQTKDEIFDLMKQNLRPEFLNRIDEVVMFNPLSREELRAIVGLQLKDVKALLAQQNIEVEFSESVIRMLGEAGYDPAFGARPLKRIIQQRITNELSKRILAGEVQPDSAVFIDIDADNELEISTVESAQFIE